MNAIEQAAEHFQRGPGRAGGIEQWSLDRVVFDPQSNVPTRVLYEDYAAWCKRANVRPLSHRLISNTLIAMGIEQGRTTGYRYWMGLRLKTG